MVTGLESLGKEQGGCTSGHVADMTRERQVRVVEGKRSRSTWAEMTATPVVTAGGRKCLISRYNIGSTVKLETGGDSLFAAWVGTLGSAPDPGTAGRAPRATALATPRRKQLSARGLRGVSLASCLCRGQYRVPRMHKQGIITVVPLGDAVLDTPPLC